MEKHIEASGLAWTFLRPNNYMENFLSFHRPDAQGNIYLPWGSGACSFVAPTDVGAVAAVTLTTDGHAGKAYTLTGPEALTIGDAARILSDATGRAIRYVDVPESAAREAMLGMKMPESMVSALMELHAIDKAGYAAAVTPAVRDVLERPPTSFTDFVRELSRARWAVA